MSCLSPQSVFAPESRFVRDDQNHGATKHQRRQKLADLDSKTCSNHRSFKPRTSIHPDNLQPGFSFPFTKSLLQRAHSWTFTPPYGPYGRSSSSTGFPVERVGVPGPMETKRVRRRKMMEPSLGETTAAKAVPAPSAPRKTHRNHRRTGANCRCVAVLDGGGSAGFGRRSRAMCVLFRRAMGDFGVLAYMFNPFRTVARWCLVVFTMLGAPSPEEFIISGCRESTISKVTTGPQTQTDVVGFGET